MARENVRVYEIATATGANLQNNEICHETSANATTGFKMFASKNDDGTVLRMLALDQNAQVADLTVTGDITTLTGSITIDALSLSTLSANRILYGDFGQASTFKWQNSKLRIGSTDAPTYAIDVSVASADGLRIEQTGSGANNPLIVYEKTSASPADNDGIGKTIYRGYDGDQSAPAKRDFVTVEALSTDVSAITGEYKISILREGMVMTYVFGANSFTTPGGQKWAKKRIAANYTILEKDLIVLIDTDGGARNVTLPAGVDNTVYYVKNVGSSGNQITLIATGSDPIEETAIADGESAHLIFDPTEGWLWI